MIWQQIVCVQRIVDIGYVGVLYLFSCLWLFLALIFKQQILKPGWKPGGFWNQVLSLSYFPGDYKQSIINGSLNCTPDDCNKVGYFELYAHL